MAGGIQIGSSGIVIGDDGVIVTDSDDAPCCCTSAAYKQARYCDDNSLADVWMTSSDAAMVPGAFTLAASSDDCLYFAGDSSDTPGTLYEPGDVELSYASCADCTVAHNNGRLCCSQACPEASYCYSRSCTVTATWSITDMGGKNIGPLPASGSRTWPLQSCGSVMHWYSTTGPGDSSDIAMQGCTWGATIAALQPISSSLNDILGFTTSTGFPGSGMSASSGSVSFGITYDNGTVFGGGVAGGGTVDIVVNDNSCCFDPDTGFCRYSTGDGTTGECVEEGM